MLDGAASCGSVFMGSRQTGERILRRASIRRLPPHPAFRSSATPIDVSPRRVRHTGWQDGLGVDRSRQRFW
jgi:hypothetical protein